MGLTPFGGHASVSLVLRDLPVGCVAIFLQDDANRVVMRTTEGYVDLQTGEDLCDKPPLTDAVVERVMKPGDLLEVT